MFHDGLVKTEKRVDAPLELHALFETAAQATEVHTFLAALPAALEDRAYSDWYLAQVRESKKALYEVLGRTGVRFWPSDGNFVLACFGDDLARVVAALAGTHWFEVNEWATTGPGAGSGSSDTAPHAA